MDDKQPETTKPNNKNMASSKNNVSQENADHTKGMRWRIAIVYALLMTALYFAFEFLFVEDYTDNPLTEKIVQASFSVGSVVKNKFIKPSDSEPVTVMLFSEQSTMVSNFGWPLDFGVFEWALYSILYPDPESAKAKSIFVDVSIRSGKHDPSGFCSLLDFLEENITSQQHTDFLSNVRDAYAAGNKNISWDKNCLDKHRYLTAFLEDKSNLTEFLSKTDKQLVGNGKYKIPIYFGASLEYLDAKKCVERYLRGGEACRNHAALRERYSEAGGEFGWQINYFLDTVSEWPATALLDLFTELVPIQVLENNGKGMHVFVGDNNHRSPAYRMLCDSAKNNYSACGGFSAEANDYADGEGFNWARDNLYLIWALRHDPRLLGNQSGIGEDYWAQDSHCQKESNADQLKSLLIKDREAPSFEELGFPTCPPFLHIDLHSYFSNKLQPATFASAVEGSHVVVAINMKRFDDIVHSPMHGRMPGAFSHAVAIENMSSNRFYKSVNTSFEASASYKLGVSLVLIKYVLIFIVIALFLKRPHWLEATLLWFQKGDRYFALMMVLGLAAIFLFLWMSGWFFYGDAENLVAGVINWALSLFLFCFLVYLLLAALAGLRIHKLLKNKKWRKIFKPGKNGLIRQASVGVGLIGRHIFVLALILFILAGVAVVWVPVLSVSPPALVEAFYGIVPYYLMVARDDIAEGFALIMGDVRIADLLMD